MRSNAIALAIAHAAALNHHVDIKITFGLSGRQSLRRLNERAKQRSRLAGLNRAQDELDGLITRYARGWTKALFYLAVMMPLWSSYLVKIYAWKLILAKEGIITWLAGQLHLSWLLDAVLALPVVGGPSLSFSYIGTFLVFVYIWSPYMILPVETALERVPRSLVEASGDLGANAAQTFRNVILPLALPGVVAGSIFTFSLTLGDFIVPTLFGNSSYFIGKAVLTYQGTSGNIPLAAAFTMGPIVIMIIYLLIARRLGAFDAL